MSRSGRVRCLGRDCRSSTWCGRSVEEAIEDLFVLFDLLAGGVADELRPTPACHRGSHPALRAAPPARHPSEEHGRGCDEYQVFDPHDRPHRRHAAPTDRQVRHMTPASLPTPASGHGVPLGRHVQERLALGAPAGTRSRRCSAQDFQARGSFLDGAATSTGHRTTSDVRFKNSDDNKMIKNESEVRDAWKSTRRDAASAAATS